jgi:hypothetical protein
MVWVIGRRGSEYFREYELPASFYGLPMEKAQGIFYVSVNEKLFSIRSDIDENDG